MAFDTPRSTDFDVGNTTTTVGGQETAAASGKSLSDSGRASPPLLRRWHFRLGRLTASAHIDKPGGGERNGGGPGGGDGRRGICQKAPDDSCYHLDFVLVFRRIGESSAAGPTVVGEPVAPPVGRFLLWPRIPTSSQATASHPGGLAWHGLILGIEIYALDDRLWSVMAQISRG